jgi:hypothetical protein
MRPVAPFLVRASVRSHPLRAALGGAVIEQAAEYGESLRFFAHAWLGGLVFFGTFLA